MAVDDGKKGNWLRKDLELGKLERAAKWPSEPPFENQSIYSSTELFNNLLACNPKILRDFMYIFQSVCHCSLKALALRSFLLF